MTKNQLIKFIEENEFDVQSALACVFAMDFVYSSYASSELFGQVNLSPVLAFANDSMDKPFYQIIRKKSISDFEKTVYLEYLKDSRGITEKLNRRNEIMIEMRKIFQNGFIDINDKNLKETFFILLELTRQWWNYGQLGEGKGQIIEELIIPKRAKNHHLDLANAKEIFSVLFYPDSPSVLSRERRAFWEICFSVLQNKNLKKLLLEKDYGGALKEKWLADMISSYLKEYFWMKTDFCRAKVFTPQMLLADIIKEIAERDAEYFRLEIEQWETNLIETRRKKQEKLATIDLSDEDRLDISFAEFLISWQDQRKVEMMEIFYYMLLAAEEMAARISIPYDIFVSCGIEEIKKILAGEMTPVKRGAVFCVFEKNKEMQIFLGDFPGQALNMVLNFKHQDEIRGMVASRGKYGLIEGIARIVNNPAVDELKGGEILITSMTRVEFIPLMKKAKAIITNEGGIACHAAIVSREMGIPCIIGTKIATKMIKNGDKIEMNMEDGAIKIK